MPCVLSAIHLLLPHPKNVNKKVRLQHYLRQAPPQFPSCTPKPNRCPYTQLSSGASAMCRVRWFPIWIVVSMRRMRMDVQRRIWQCSSRTSKRWSCFWHIQIPPQLCRPATVLDLPHWHWQFVTNATKWQRQFASGCRMRRYRRTEVAKICFIVLWRHRTLNLCYSFSEFRYFFFQDNSF